MKNIINAIGINTVDFINGRKGEFRAVVKCKAGFFTIAESKDRYTSGAQVLNSFQKGALQTVEFKAEGSDNWLTVFALKGKKVVLIDSEILAELEVGTINCYFLKTNLYSQAQYAAVKATTWASKAFVMNEPKEIVLA